MLDFIPAELWDNIFLAFKYVYWVMPIWLPAACIAIWFQMWLRYKRLKFWQKEGSILLEIKLPREIDKSPLAMEVVLGTLHQTGGESTWYDRIRKGQTRSWFSLEIVSQEGRVRFFIWTKPKHKNAIEAQIYAQYPGVEVQEVEDYTKSFYYNPGENEIWACDFNLVKADPYPIKTYVDYGLDRDPKEEYKVDPMVSMLEFLGSITAGQNIWIQIIVRSHKKRRVFDVFSEKEDSWKDEAKKEIDNIIEQLKVKKEEGGFPRIPTKGEADVIAALERSVSKYPFQCIIRALYLTNKDKFNPVNIGGIIGSVKQYGSVNLNGFKPTGWFIDFDYPWQEWFGKKEKIKQKVLEEYKLRRFFYSPYKGRKFHDGKPFILNAEELATIFHFPGAVAGTPTFERVPSRKAEAPFNLPI